MNKGGIKSNPYVLMLLLMIMWGSLAAVSKLVLISLDSFQVQFLMFGTAVVIMTVTLFFNGKLEKFRELSSGDYLKLSILALPSFFYYFMYILALKKVSAVEASMLNYLFPVMIVIFSVPINKEKLDAVKIISILTGFAGTVVIVTNGRFDYIRLTNLPGDVLAVGAAVCWGVFSNLGKKSNIDQFVSNYVYAFVSFILSIISLIAFSSFAIPGIKVFAGIIWLSLSNIVLAYYLWFKVLKITSSALVASLSFITPFLTLAFIILLLGEKITMVQLVGLLIIMAGIAVQNVKKI